MKIRALSALIVMALAAASCSKPKTSEELRKEIQEQLINAKPGDVVKIPEGRWEMSASLLLDGVENVTLRGAGMDKTILAFRDQQEGAEGLKVKANGVVIEGFTVQDMKGDGIKVYESENITIRNVKVLWTQGPDSSNGAYGLYPVKCNGVLVENCVVSGASDAGIYVGQSFNCIIRENDCSANVQGIEAENCSEVLIYANKLHNNTSGISVNNLPDLPVKNGKGIKVYENEIRNNNLDNFGAPGSIVYTIPAGTGLFVVSGENVEIFRNVFENHKTTGVAIISFPLTRRPLNDSLYYPFTKGVYVHGNTYSNQPGMVPDTSRELGAVMAMLFKTSPPDVVFDGFYDPAVSGDRGATPPASRICVKENEKALVASIDAPNEFKQVSLSPDGLNCELEFEVKPDMK